MVDWSGLRAVQVEVALLLEVLLVPLLVMPLLVKVPLLLAEGLGVDDEDDGRAVEVTTDAELDDADVEIVTMDSIGALPGVAFEDVELDDAETPLTDSDVVEIEEVLIVLIGVVQGTALQSVSILRMTDIVFELDRFSGRALLRDCSDLDRRGSRF